MTAQAEHYKIVKKPINFPLYVGLIATSVFLVPSPYTIPSIIITGITLGFQLYIRSNSIFVEPVKQKNEE